MLERVIQEKIPLNKILSNVANLEESFDGARKQMITELPAWLKKTPNFSKNKFSGYNIFHVTAMHDLVECVPLLAANSEVLATINNFSENKSLDEKLKKDEEVLTPLMMAVIYGNYKIALELIKYGADLWQKNMYERSALFFVEDVKLRNDLRKVSYESAFEKRGFFRSTKPSSKLTIVDLAEFIKVIENKGNILKTIVKKGFDLDGNFFFRLMDLVEYSPAQKNNIVKLIDVILRDNFPRHFSIGTHEKSNNLYHYAAEYNIVELIEIIRGAESKAFNLKKIDHLNGEGLTPLMIAKQKQNAEMIKALTEFGAKL